MRYVLVLALVILGGCSDGNAGNSFRQTPGPSTQAPPVPRSERDSMGLALWEARTVAVVDKPPVGNGNEGVQELSADGGVLDALPTATPTPTPLVPDVPGATAPAEAGEPSVGSDSAVVEPLAGVVGGEPAALPTPRLAGTLVSGATLTVYSCLNDGTGSYCPEGQAMYSGQQVHRGAIACSWNWPIGQRLRIIGDPLDMIYTCLDRGGGLGSVGWIDVWFYDALDPATQAWRAQVHEYYDSHLVTVELLY